MEFPIISQNLVLSFSLVLVRVGSLIGTMPLFGEQLVPVRVKAGLSLVIAILLFPVVSSFVPPVPDNFFALFFMMLSEALIGAVLGFSARLIFAAAQLAGEVMGMQIGFSVANVVDPVSRSHISLIGQVQYIFAILIFLLTNAHHVFLGAIADSFQITPSLFFHSSAEWMSFFVGLVRNMFILAVKLSIPVVAVIFLSNVGLGVVARTVPQINVFIVGFPLHIAIGLIFLGLTMPLGGMLLQNAYGDLSRSVYTLLKVMK